jgi:hypothetical protein
MSLALVVAVLAGTIALLATRGSTPEPRFRESVGLVVARERPFSVSRPTSDIPAVMVLLHARSLLRNPVYAMRADVGSVMELAFERASSSASLAPALVIGSTVVARGSGAIWTFPATMDGPLSVLGTGSDVIASRTPGRVWIVEEDDPASVLREVTLEGEETSPRRTLPRGTEPLEAVEGGILIGRRWQGNRSFRVWDPESGATRTLGLGADANYLDAAGRLVAWLEQGREPWKLHILDLATGRDRVLPPPSEIDGMYIDEASFSPDGARIAIGFRPEGSEPSTRVAIVDVDDGSAFVIDGPMAVYVDCWPCIAWTLDGDRI